MMVHGKPWSTVPILQLRNYGGVDHGQLANGEWWRLLTAQFVHVKQAHMLFNVVTLFLLALAVERATGPFVLLSLWLLSGVAGILASIYFTPPPYDIGSGASQALMGIAATAIIVMWRNQDQDRPRWLMVTLGVTLVVQLALDLTSTRYPQPGHVVGFVVGFILAIGLVPNSYLIPNQVNSSLVRTR
jgi:rhomboid protease GluP